MIAEPCLCRKFVPNTAWTPGQCAICWHWYHTPSFREGCKPRTTTIVVEDTSTPHKRHILLCTHRGAATGKKVLCPTCTGRVELKLFSCTVHGQCTPTKQVSGTAYCGNCVNRLPHLPRSVGKRHLSYHVYPIRNSCWRERVAQITRSWELFDGVKVVAIATDNRTDSIQDVTNTLPSDTIILPFTNDPKLGETLTWSRRWETILQHAHDNDAVLYAHAKGVTRPQGHYQEWAELCHTLSLDHWYETEQLLQRYPIVGSLRKHGFGFPKPSYSSWHYSGTFYWMRVSELHRRNWRSIAPHRWGVESWPGEQFGLDESASLFGEFKNPGTSYPYPEFEIGASPSSWRVNVVPAYQRWLSARDPNGIPIDIITPCTRPMNLHKIRASLDLLTGFHHRWHVLDSPGNTFGNTERNNALARITRDSWIHYLDDDNLIHPLLATELKSAIRMYPNAVGFVFRQQWKDGRTRLHAQIATKVGQIDTAQFVFKRSAIGDIQWPVGRAADYGFFRNVYTASPQEVVVIDRPACYYNVLR